MDSRNVVAILEDDGRRIDAMRAVLGKQFPNLHPQVFAAAPEIIRWLGTHQDTAAAISLDHDLDPLESPPPATDPGTGRDVADFLASRTPTCPIIIHSSNADGAAGMRRVLEDADWAVHVVVPLNDLAWIPTAWTAALRAAVTLSD